MPATYEVHGGIAYPSRQRYTGPLCPDCQRRGRHMPWCSNATPTTAPVPVPAEEADEAPVNVLPEHTAGALTCPGCNRSRGTPHRRDCAIGRDAIREVAKLQAELAAKLEVIGRAERPKLTVVRSAPPKKPRAGSLPPDEEAYIARELAWAAENGWEVPKFEKLLRRNARARVAYLAARIPWRSVTPGRSEVDEAWYLRHTIWGELQRGSWPGHTRNDSPAEATP